MRTVSNQTKTNKELVHFDQSVAGKLACELDVLFSPGYVLGNRQIMRFQAKPSHAIRVSRRQVYESPLPALRQDRGLHVDGIRIALGNEINLGGEGDFIGQVRIFPVKRLAADDDDLSLARCAPGSPQDAINVLLLHSGVRSLHAAAARRRAGPAHRAMCCGRLPSEELSPDEPAHGRDEGRRGDGEDPCPHDVARHAPAHRGNLAR